MAPLKTHGTSPQQDLTRPVEGRPSGLRPEDLLLGGREGANPHAGPRVATENSTFTRLDAYQTLVAHAKTKGKNFRPSDVSPDERTSAILHAMGLPKELADESGLKKIVATFTSKCEGFYIASKRNAANFLKKHSKWLNEDFKQQFNQFLNPEQLVACTDASSLTPSVDRISAETVNVSKSGSNEETYHTRSHGPVSTPEPPTPKRRPSKVYELLSARQQSRQRKRLKEVLKDEPQAKLIKVFTETVEVNGERLSKAHAKDLEQVIHACLQSPDSPGKIAAAIKKDNPKPFTPEEALDLFIKMNHSVRSYTVWREDLKSRGFDALPPYYKVVEARKKRDSNNSGASEKASVSNSTGAGGDAFSDKRMESDGESDSDDSCWNLVLPNEFQTSSDYEEAPISEPPS